jgi:hypothetical protein
MVELLSGRLRNIAVDCGVSGSSFCAIGLHDLTGNFLLTQLRFRQGRTKAALRPRRRPGSRAARSRRRLRARPA